jgi:hypothetical protein
MSDSDNESTHNYKKDDSDSDSDSSNIKPKIKIHHHNHEKMELKNPELVTTDDYRKHIHVQRVINNMKGNNEIFNMTDAKDDSHKEKLLVKIGKLRTNLKNANVDIDNIPNVDSSSSKEDVKKTFKKLDEMYADERYSTFANEMLVGAAELVETHIFNGKNIYFGKYRPNAEGWHNSVQVKLRGLSYETSSVVSDIMSYINLSEGTKILITLLPSLGLQINENSKNQNTESLYSKEKNVNLVSELRSTIS